MQCNLIGPPTFPPVKSEWNRPLPDSFPLYGKKWSGSKTICTLPPSPHLHVRASVIYTQAVVERGLGLVVALRNSCIVMSSSTVDISRLVFDTIHDELCMTFSDLKSLFLVQP